MTSSYNFLNGNSYLSNKCVKQLIFTCGKFILTTAASVIIARVKITFLIPIPTSLLLYPFPSLPYLFHSSYLPSVFILYFSLLLSLPSLISLHPFHIIMLDCLSLSPHSTFYTACSRPLVSSLLRSPLCFFPGSHFLCPSTFFFVFFPFPLSSFSPFLIPLPTEKSPFLHSIFTVLPLLLFSYIPLLLLSLLFFLLSRWFLVSSVSLVLVL
jgi:hypothetical protein